jgi:YbbR domain-containing protein
MNEKDTNNTKKELQNLTTTFDENGKIKRTKKRSTVLPKILSVFAAIILWLYVYQAVEYEGVIKDVPVSFENFNNNLGLDIVSGYESTVDVTLKGTKSAINKLTKNDIKATVDLSQVTELGDYTLPIKTDPPNGAKIVEQSISEINLSVDKTIKKSISVQPKINYTLQYPYEIGEVSVEPGEIEVTGPETDINAISTAEAEINLGSIRNNVISSVPLVLKNANGYEVSSKYIVMKPGTAKISVSVLKTALYGIKPDIQYNGNYNITYQPTKVYVKGLVNDVDAINEVNTEQLVINLAGAYNIKLSDISGLKYYDNYKAEEGNIITDITVIAEEKTPIVPEKNEDEE